MTIRIPLIDLKAQYATIRAEVHAAIDRVVESQQFILGPEVEAFEREVATYCGTRFAIGVSSGTDALLVVLMSLGVGPGDEILTTPYTFVATATAIARLGAIPIFADIDPGTFNLDPTQVERRITRKTKAIAPVHLFGQMADVEGIVDVAERHGIPLVEDAAQAIGAECAGRRAGSVGCLGCLSFFPTKNLGAFGDAGMVVTNDEQLATRVRQLRNHGQQTKHIATIVGGNFRLDAIQAAVLRAKLRHLDFWIEARRRNAAQYRQLFADAAFASAIVPQADALLVLPFEVPGSRHVYNQFVVLARRRDELRSFLAQQGIASEIYYRAPLHLQTPFASDRYAKGDFPRAERASDRALSLPMYAELCAADQEAIVREVVRFYS